MVSKCEVNSNLSLVQIQGVIRCLTVWLIPARVQQLRIATALRQPQSNSVTVYSAEHPCGYPTGSIFSIRRPPLTLFGYTRTPALAGRQFKYQFMHRARFDRCQAFRVEMQLLMPQWMAYLHTLKSCALQKLTLVEMRNCAQTCSPRARRDIDREPQDRT